MLCSFFLLMTRRRSQSPLFPYTTLFRSLAGRKRLGADLGLGVLLWGVPMALVALWTNRGFALVLFAAVGVGNTSAKRSEEHTSELQSPDQLVCRPLLEKKKNSSFRRAAA